jgi:fumarylpyruvate hydrolase
MQYVIDAPAPATAPVAGSDEVFPIRRVFCVGRNYVEHAKEMGHSGREAPFFFMKPADSILPVPYGTTGEMPYPDHTADLHHEIELVAAIGKGGANIAAADALSHVWGYAVGLDMTRRDLQGEAKKLGRPWDTGKAFDFSAPMGPLHPAGALHGIEHATIMLTVNGEPRQNGTTDQMIWNVAEIIEHLSKYFTLIPGDLIFTGTPAGVGACQKGDLLDGGVGGLGELRVKLV